MKKLITQTLLIAALTIIATSFKAGNSKGDNKEFPKQMTFKVKPYYRHLKDGKAGREIELTFIGAKIYDKAQLEVSQNGKIIETYQIQSSKEGTEHFTFVLPADIGVNQDAHIDFTLRSGKNVLKQNVTIHALRQWIVFVYPHSHVDIGYSNTQANVEIIHKRNLLNGIRIAKETQNYPEGSRYLWDPEVVWSVERYLYNATREQQDELLDGIKKKYIMLNAAYVNVNTSLCNDEEMFRLFQESRLLQKKTGVPVNTFVQTDVPGISWGLIPVMQQEGIKYVYSLYNGDARVGTTSEMTDRPFWWVGPDGKSKVLYFQPNDGYLQYSFDKGFSKGRPWLGQIDINKIPETFKTNEPRKYFLGDNLFAMLDKLEKSDYYPYDLFSLSWGLWDNTPIDEDLPAAVKSWNEEYSYPHLVIASAGDIMSAFDKKYGDKLPVYHGDLTEYWTDGAGTAAEFTKMNLSSAERLVQSETLWTMLNRGKPTPESYFNEAWRNTILGTEHTYVYERTGLNDVSWSMDKTPADAYFRESIYNVKKSYFREADLLSKTMLTWSLVPAKDSISPKITVFNTLSWNRSGLVILSPEQSATGDLVIDESGKALPSQRLSTGELAFLTPDIPALGSAAFKVEAGQATSPQTPCSIDGISATNGLIRVEVNPVTGNIASLKQAGSKYDFVNADADGGLNIFRQLPGGINNPKSDSVIHITIKEKGPLVVEWQVNSKAPGCNSVSRQVRLIAGQPLLELTDIINKQKIIKKEGLHIGFTFNIPNPVTHVDIPWGVMRVETDQMPAANRNWLTLQRWLDISNDKCGVTWVSMDAPLFEVGSMTANILGEGTGWIRHLTPSPTIYSWVINNHWFTNFPLSQEGEFTFRYRLMPHENVYDAATANRFGMEQKQPLIVTTGKKSQYNPIVQINGSKAIVIAILKTIEDGNSVIIRLRSVSDKDEVAKLSWASNPTKLFICETEEEPGKLIKDEVTVPANGFVTLRAEW